MSDRVAPSVCQSIVACLRRFTKQHPCRLQPIPQKWKLKSPHLVAHWHQFPIIGTIGVSPTFEDPGSRSVQALQKSRRVRLSGSRRDTSVYPLMTPATPAATAAIFHHSPSTPGPAPLSSCVIRPILAALVEIFPGLMRCRRAYKL